MNKYVSRTAIAAVIFAFGSEAMATEWNVSLWGKRRAFTEHVEKLAELVSAKTNGEFTLNISYGGLSANRENLDGISIGAFEMAQFCAGYHRDKNPSITVLELPFLGVTSLEQEVELSMAVYQHPATVADLERWNAKLLMPSHCRSTTSSASVTRRQRLPISKASACGQPAASALQWKRSALYRPLCQPRKCARPWTAAL